MEEIQQPLGEPPSLEKPAQEYKINSYTSVAGYGVGVLTAENYHEKRNPPVRTCIGFCGGCGSSGSSQAKKV